MDIIWCENLYIGDISCTFPASVLQLASMHHSDTAGNVPEISCVLAWDYT